MQKTAHKEMRCSFFDRSSLYIVPAFSHGHSHGAASSTVSTTASIPAPTPWPEHTTSNPESFNPYSVNMTHLELFNNLFSKEFLSFEESGQPDIIPTALYTKHALTTPYLMHQILAMSALQLSTRTTDSRRFYREYATGLQNRALSLFNESKPVLEVTPANCVHMFLFSSLIGVHLLCDTLHYQRDSLEGFIDRFTYCLSVYRGVLAVIDQSWHLLRETELGPRLKLSRVLTEPTDASGSECDTLRDLVNVADGTPSSRKAYRESVLHLQQVFDAQRAASGNKTRIPVIFAWPILVSPDYVDLLRQRQAEALVILAHYAVLLHRGRNLWLIGEGGQFLIESICGSLGSDWQEWLKFPKAALQEEGLTA
ncbi:uncharacterized protein Z518_03428 [Rhinocladiella mackenziei CBS 650.93]|uniref:Zn(II)2Cys6 transcription factor n=1 Tax=Rhinocladiella mackenziei CBS 650.93 TaxID=1442369 RepID=A0A0D2IZB9_9EURO|nr:uncharacterized protein Z518_03428 [Rhinocladiella mackenziei CBS 650.93]KIX08771.1 hypothetical protein Z518_03428 [Rhinocladiella mackenziei CBS 650.93]